MQQRENDYRQTDSPPFAAVEVVTPIRNERIFDSHQGRYTLC